MGASVGLKCTPDSTGSPERRMMNTGVVIIARAGSTRAEGKMLADIAGKPLLVRLIDRLKLAKEPDVIVLATTCRANDNALAETAEREAISVYRGAEEDVIERMGGAVQTYDLDLAIIAEGDELFCDEEYVDAAIRIARDEQADCVKTKDLPIGSWVVAVRRQALEEVYEAKGDASTEAFARYFTEDSAYRTEWLPLAEGTPAFSPRVRLTIDYPEDIELARQLYQRLEGAGRSTSLREVLTLMSEEPDLVEVNAFRTDEYYARINKRVSMTANELTAEEDEEQ